MDIRVHYRNAAALALVTAILHGVVLVIGGAPVQTMLLGLVLWVAAAWGMAAGWRAVAYLAFLLGLFGGVVSMGYALGAFGVSAITLWAMASVDWAVALVMFVALWPARQMS